ncbi:hypothetical protein KY284_030235 [Solanum tuberosum]|nr:hypothetical protein KY284_030235 [Solanum tuberosum]
MGLEAAIFEVFYYGSNMKSESSFVQPAVSKFVGYYDHWAMFMGNFVQSKEYWSLWRLGFLQQQKV